MVTCTVTGTGMTVPEGISIPEEIKNKSEVILKEENGDIVILWSIPVQSGSSVKIPFDLSEMEDLSDALIKDICVFYISDGKIVPEKLDDIRISRNGCEKKGTAEIKDSQFVKVTGDYDKNGLCGLVGRYICIKAELKCSSDGQTRFVFVINNSQKSLYIQTNSPIYK